MKAILYYVSTVMDIRQEKSLHRMKDIILLVFFASLGNEDDWGEMEVFGGTRAIFAELFETPKWDTLP